MPYCVDWPIAIWQLTVFGSIYRRDRIWDLDSQPIRMAANGRLSIPAKQRKALGLENGGMVVSTVENGELRIRTVKAVLD